MTNIQRPAPPQAALDAIAAIVGEKGVITGEDRAPYLTEWRRRWNGEAAMIIAPASTEEVSKVVKICAEHDIAITPQGGNTGLVGGQIPFGPEILILMKRLRGVRDVSPLNNTMTVEAGVTLAEAQNLAADADRLFPLSIGSEGTCQIGGVISTNAGGVNVLRYGNTRDLVLGLEAVLPDGRIWNGLKRLRKNNTGYDLKHLLIGGEGTLGIVTAAVLKLYPAPAEKVTALAGVKSAHEAVALLAHAQNATGGGATSFEMMNRLCVELASTHIEGVRDPFETPHHTYVLMEFSSGDRGNLQGTVEAMLESAFEQGLVEDAVLAASEAQAKALWHMRHSMSEAINTQGKGVRHDVSVATSDIPEFLDEAGAAVSAIAPGARFASFGHIGDGNVHYDIVGPEGSPMDALQDQRDEIENTVYDVIDALDGSISAEHGIGLQRRDTLAARKSDIELDMMRAVKNALDPKGIMNPGKMLQEQ